MSEHQFETIKAKILLLEDDATLGEVLSERLKKEGFYVQWVDSFKSALELIHRDKEWSLALLDVGLPDGSGFDFAAEMQKINYEIPFLFLTAQSDAESRLKGYELGADEYIPKPFHLKELLMRLQRVLKTYAASDAYKTDHCEIRVNELIVIQNDQDIKTHLTSNEMKLLELIIKSSPKVVHRDQVIDVIWGENKDLNQRTIDNMVVKLRTALGPDGQKLKTVRGVGYQYLN